MYVCMYVCMEGWMDGWIWSLPVTAAASVILEKMALNDEENLAEIKREILKVIDYSGEDKQVMKQCINFALNLPDFSYREKDGKYVHIKHFKFSVGHLGFLNAQQIRSKLCSVLNSTISLSFQHFPVYNT